jgi:hypothetical protein
MRFLETLLLVFAAIYVAQLIIAALLIATLMLFLWCLWKRPREALLLGAGVLMLAFITKPIGLAVAAGLGACCLAWLAMRSIVANRRRSKRPQARLLLLDSHEINETDQGS